MANVEESQKLHTAAPESSSSQTATAGGGAVQRRPFLRFITLFVPVVVGLATYAYFGIRNLGSDRESRRRREWRAVAVV